MKFRDFYEFTAKVVEYEELLKKQIQQKKTFRGS